MTELKEGWISRQCKRIQEDFETWPEWMKRCVAERTEGRDVERLSVRELIDAEPHYITAPTVSDWRSEVYPNRAAAQKWIDDYMVSPEYKERTYVIVPVRLYWERRARELR